MKPVTKVFLVIATLALCLIIWSVFFGGGGVLETAWNAVVSPVNDKWSSITGSPDAKLIPEFTDAGGQNVDNLGEAGPGASGP